MLRLVARAVVAGGVGNGPPAPPGLPAVTHHPLLHVTLMTLGVDAAVGGESGSGGRAEYGAPCAVEVQVVLVALRRRAAAGAAKVTRVGDIRHASPVGAHDVLVVLGQQIRSADAWCIVPGVRRGDVEEPVLAGNPVGAKARGDGEAGKGAPPVLRVVRVIVGADVAGDEAAGGGDGVAMEGNHAGGRVIGVAKHIILVVEAAVGIISGRFGGRPGLQVNPGLDFVRTGSLGDVITHVVGDG